MTAARIGLGIWVALTRHTLYIANDNDFLASFNGVDNPNKFFVFAFDDTDLPGFQPQPIREQDLLECGADLDLND